MSLRLNQKTNDMNEREYIDATDLSKVRMIQATLRDICTDNSECIDNKEYASVIDLVWQWSQRLEKAVVVNNDDPDTISCYRTALADAIRRPMGVFPDSSEGLITEREVMDAERRRVEKKAKPKSRY